MSKVGSRPNENLYSVPKVEVPGVVLPGVEKATSIEKFKEYGLSEQDLDFAVQKMRQNLIGDGVSSALFDKTFVDRLKDFQREKGIAADGIVDMEVLDIFTSGYPINIFAGNTNIENALKKYPKTEKTKIRTETREQLTEAEKATLFSEVSLGKIQVSINDAYLLADKQIPNNGKLSKGDIMKFQEVYGLSVDGKIGAETYMELLGQSTILALKDSIKNKTPLSLQLKKDILLIFENPGKIETVTELGVELGRTETKELYNRDHNFMKKLEESQKKGQAKIKQKLENPEDEGNITNISGNNKTLVEKIMDGEVEEALKDPTGWLILGGLYLFGFLGDKGSSIWSRLGKLTGGYLIYKVAGGDKALDKFASLFSQKNIKKASETVSEAVKKGSEVVRDGYEKARESAGEVFKNGFSLSGVWEGVKRFFFETYDVVSLGIGRYNEGLKSIDGGKDYIETEKLNGLRNIILSDEQFLNKQKSELTNATYTNLLSDSAKQKLTELYKGDTKNKDKHINTFIKKHILEHAMKDVEPGELVRNMYYFGDLKNTIDETLTSGMVYSENTKLNKQINNNVITFTNDASDESEKMKRAGTDLKTAIKNGTVASFQLSTYGLQGNNNAKTALSEIQRLVGIDTERKTLETEIGEKIADLEKCRLNNTDTVDSIKGKITNLLEYENKFKDKYNSNTLVIGKVLDTSDFSVSKFETETYDIKSALLKALPENATVEVKNWVDTDSKEVFTGAVPVSELLIQLEGQKQKMETQKQIDALSQVGEVPPTSATEAVFKKYLEANLKTFQAAKKLDQNNSKVKGVMEKFNELVVRLSEKHTQRIEESSKINEEVISLTTNAQNLTQQDVKTRLDTLKDLETRFLQINADIRGENLMGKTFDAVAGSNPGLNLYISFNEQIQSVDDTKSIDGQKLETGFQNTKGKIVEARKEIFSNLDISLEFSNLDVVKNGNDIQVKVMELTALERFISDQSVKINLKNGLIERLNGQIARLIDKYKDAIKKSDLSGLKAIKDSYQKNVYKAINGEKFKEVYKIFFGKLETGREEIETAIEGRIEEVIGQKDVPTNIWNDFAKFVGNTENIPENFNTSINVLLNTIKDGKIGSFKLGLESFIQSIPPKQRNGVKNKEIIKKFRALLSSVNKYIETEKAKINI